MTTNRLLCAGLALSLSQLLAACADDAAPAAASDVDAGHDAGDACTSDACGPDPDPCPDGEVPTADGGCEPAPACESGIDTNGDGVCDHDVADWSRDARVEPGTHRADIYQLGDALPDVAQRGLGHSLVWPVDISGVLLPWGPMSTLLAPDPPEEQTRALQDLARLQLGFGNLEEMYDWLGVARYDGSTMANGNIAWPADLQVGAPLGAGIVDTAGGEALSFSCATCHTADMFGRTVVGLTNREARANEFFHAASSFFPALTEDMLRSMTGAEGDSLEMFLRTQDRLGFIGNVIPQVRGLDTSLAQVSLSLARRGEDPYATLDDDARRSPRPNDLETFVADSKPAVWWTMRYKTRWLSDGSIVSGNPVYTNFLWNELGRGTDLHDLEQWLQDNQDAVDELTAFVFATEAPRFEDFFGVDAVDLEAAQRGQALFDATCASCHGTYEKAWDLPDTSGLSAEALLATTRVVYHAQTPVMDVGTDPQRAQGMAAFASRLNDLAVSQYMQTVVEVQPGYVPPPLDGIWARYPYLHNQSVPTLCDLLRPADQRTAVFWMGTDDDPDTDYDLDCVGYPVGEATPASWQDEPTNEYDTSRPGLGNMGHDEWLVDADGNAVFDDADIRDLIEYLETL